MLGFRRTLKITACTLSDVVSLYACMLGFCHTLEIIARTLREVVLVCLYAGILRLFACSLEFRRTLKIIARTLREVVNRVRLCCQHTSPCSNSLNTYPPLKAREATSRARRSIKQHISKYMCICVHPESRPSLRHEICTPPS